MGVCSRHEIDLLGQVRVGSRRVPYLALVRLSRVPDDAAMREGVEVDTVER
jgi:hypothetical protein